MDERFFKINRLLSEYSLGNFDKKLRMSSRQDEVDAFINGINMLGDELKDRTISRDYFNDIFNSVSDMVFVVDKEGKIENINTPVTQHLQYELESLTGKLFEKVLEKPGDNWFAGVLKDIRNKKAGFYETAFRSKDQHTIPVLISASPLAGGKGRKGKILMTAKDISAQKKAQNMVLKAIIETEEKERLRFAEDIHDSIGQQLSAIKFYIGTSADAVNDPKQKEILLKANTALLAVQQDMRNICFNIMPKSLEKFGMIKAVEELCTKNAMLGKMKIIIRKPEDMPRLPVQQEFALFRIIQEFINNSLKHSRADTLQMEFAPDGSKLLIRLSDNGVGFDKTKLRQQGMGLNNVQSRIRPYNGEVEIISRPGKGTRYEIAIPLSQP